MAGRVLGRDGAHSLFGACAAVGAVLLEGELQVYQRALSAGAETGTLEAHAARIDAELRSLAARLEEELAR